MGEIPRDKLSASSKNTLGAISTIFKLTEEAEEGTIKLLKNKEEPEEDAGNEDAESNTIKEDMLAKAREFIKDKVLKLDWEEVLG